MKIIVVELVVIMETVIQCDIPLLRKEYQIYHSNTKFFWFSIFKIEPNAKNFRQLFVNLSVHSEYEKM